MKEDTQSQYDDMIYLQHPISKKHPQMPLQDRAAQFSPFAALSGYEGAIKETSRLTNEKIQLDETVKLVLDKKIRILQQEIEQEHVVEITYFKQDQQKEGGEYLTVKGSVKKIDVYHQRIFLQDEISIKIEDILNISGEIFHFLDDHFS